MVIQSAIRVWMGCSVPCPLFVLATLVHAARAGAARTTALSDRTRHFLRANFFSDSLSFLSKSSLAFAQLDVFCRGRRDHDKLHFFGGRPAVASSFHVSNCFLSRRGSMANAHRAIRRAASQDLESGL